MTSSKTKLDYPLTNDLLFKKLFEQYPDLLKRLVAQLLFVEFESIEEFVVNSPEIKPDIIGDKFCCLDINMTVNAQRVDLEIQVANEGDYPERSLYYWAREFSSALKAGVNYIDLPRTIVISIVAFKLFTCREYYSEFRPLEVKRHEELTDRMSLQYYELLKLPSTISKDDELMLWLTLFNAKTDEDLAQILALEVPVMNEAIEAYNHVSTSDEFRELERLRTRTRANEASALGHARDEERKKWQKVVEDKEAAYSVALADKEAAYSVALADKDAEIAALKAQLEKG